MIFSKDHLNLAIKTVQGIGKILFQSSKSPVKINWEDNKDIKCSMDIASNEYIISELKRVTSYPILSEESCRNGEVRENEPYWIVDPLDGTMNLAPNFPMACISIALWQNSEPILGVVYDFNPDRF